MNTNNEFTPVMIKCPACDTVQAAIVEHTIPFGTYIHHCEKCKYIIMESEWDTVKSFILTPSVADGQEALMEELRKSEIN